MATENGKNSREPRLTAWKEIAAFVGRDERTVRRWEESRGLPVRRFPGAGHASVFAYTHEIEAWMRGSATADTAAAQSVTAEPNAPRPSVRPRLARWAAVAALALFGIAIAVMVTSYRGERTALLPGRLTKSPGHVPDSIAAELYRSGLHEWQTRTPSGLARAVADFNQAVARDPHYAEAYAGLADAYNLQREFTAIPPDRVYPKAEAAARRAIALDPSLASAHAALAFVEFYWSRDAAGARREFKRALALDPASAVAHHWYATFLMTIGEFDAALEEIGKAQTLDSESAAILADKGLILYYAGRQEQAVRLLTQLEDDQPAFVSPHRYLATIWLAAGNDTAYLRELKLTSIGRHDSQGTALADAGAKGLALAGHSGMLRAMLAAQRAFYLSGKQTAYGLAETYAALDDAQDAMTFLAISVSRHEADTIALKVDPPFATLRNDRRFVALMSKAGLVALSSAPAQWVRASHL